MCGEQKKRRAVKPFPSQSARLFVFPMSSLAVASTAGGKATGGGGAQASTSSAAASTSTSYALRVFLRIRPPLPKEATEESVLSISTASAADGGVQTVSVIQSAASEPASASDKGRSAARHGHTAFSFDGVFGPTATQHEVFTRAVEPQVAACLQGFNATAFCYGPSGTGKSFTCYGPAQSVGSGSASASKWAASPTAGMIPRAAEQLFATIERGQGSLQQSRFLLRVSFLQLYRETLSDLLNPSGGGGASLALREDPTRGVFVEGLTEVAVRSPAEMWALAAKGQRARSTAATRLNDVSSRSHAVFTVVVEQTVGGGGGGEKGAAAATAPCGGARPRRLLLRGAVGGGAEAVAPQSRRPRRLGARGAPRRERRAPRGVEEDQPLALRPREGHLHPRRRQGARRPRALPRLEADAHPAGLARRQLPHRDDRVRLAVAGVAEDTLSTLHFASRAKTIQNHARVNVQASEQASSSLLAQYEAQLAQLREQLREAEVSRAVEQTPSAAPEELRLESEKAIAAEAALAQCVREYAKERAQKVRLQQQISALQKRLLRTQIDELQNKVIIGGKPLDEDGTPPAGTPSAATPRGGAAPTGWRRRAPRRRRPTPPMSRRTRRGRARSRRRASRSRSPPSGGVRTSSRGGCARCSRASSS